MKSLESGGGAVYTVDFDAAGKTVLATTADGALRAHDIASGGTSVVDAGVGWGYHTWDVSRDGRFIAGPGKGGVVIWDQKTLREVRTIAGNAGGTSYVAFSPNGRALATTGGDGVVRIWDTATGQLVSTPGEGLGAGSRLRFTQDGRSLVVWGNDRQIHIYGPTKDGKVPPKKSVEQTPPIIDEDD